MRTEPEQNMSIGQWEDLCEGTYPGYGDTETEARAYAALTEVLDEAKPHEMLDLMDDRAFWTHGELQQHLLYEHDQRITDLVKLLLHHDWTPPQHLAYMLVEATSSEPVAMGNRIMPHEEEHLDFGAAMIALRQDS